MDENPYEAPQGLTPADRMDEAKDADYPATVPERRGCALVLMGVALVGAVFLFCVLVTHLWPGAGKPDVVGFPLMILFGSAWTIGALLLAWGFCK